MKFKKNIFFHEIVAFIDPTVDCYLQGTNGTVHVRHGDVPDQHHPKHPTENLRHLRANEGDHQTPISEPRGLGHRSTSGGSTTNKVNMFSESFLVVVCCNPFPLILNASPK
jgi:hypothetical protein